MPCFEIVVLSAPSKKEIEDGVTEKLILGPKAIVAKEEKAALLGIAQAEELKGADWNKVSIIIRPFA